LEIPFFINAKYVAIMAKYAEYVSFEVNDGNIVVINLL